ncbi:MAG: glycosyltransferase family 4 protein [Candidatus Promineifilaceae bacterium]
MKILQVLTYYRPHISGLTIYAERLSRELAAEGHEVIVLTSQYERNLPGVEVRDGVQVVRVPVLARVNKGVIMPTFGPRAWRLVRAADIVQLHLPQFDAPGVALRGRLLGKPVVLSYHSDIQLPPGGVNRLAEGVIGAMNRAAGALADVVVAYTQDFASHSPFLSRFIGGKLRLVPPPVELAAASAAEVEQFRQKHDLVGKRVIGISARLAAEKGIEVLLSALPQILQDFPEARILHASPEALGEAAYAGFIRPLIESAGEHYRPLGALHGSQLTAFYRNLDCLVLCSLNSTETFGLVQVEAMMNGVPVVASDLPGVRQPVRLTGMGEIVPPGAPAALAAAVVRVLSRPVDYRGSPEAVARAFSPQETATEYLRLFRELLGEGYAVRREAEPRAYRELRQLRDAL